MKTIVTYKQNEADLFEYIESKRSKSSFIKDLLERIILDEQTHLEIFNRIK